MKDYTYIFKGLVYPKRVIFNLKGLPSIEVESIDWKIKGKFTLEISNCDISVMFISTNEFTNKTNPNMETLKNFIERVTRDFVDAFCFVNSYNYDVDIESVNCKETNYKYRFSIVGEWNIKGDNQQFLKLLNAMLTKNDKVLGLSLSDFRRAIKYPDMTAAFCFRSIETLRREYFDEAFIKDDNKRDKAGWQNMAQVLNISRNQIYEKMRDLAEKNRHGIYPAVSYQEREQMMNFSREVINKFVDWLLKKPRNTQNQI